MPGVVTMAQFPPIVRTDACSGDLGVPGLAVLAGSAGRAHAAPILGVVVASARVAAEEAGWQAQYSAITMTL